MPLQEVNIARRRGRRYVLVGWVLNVISAPTPSDTAGPGASSQTLPFSQLRLSEIIVNLLSRELWLCSRARD